MRETRGGQNFPFHSLNSVLTIDVQPTNITSANTHTEIVINAYICICNIYIRCIYTIHTYNGLIYIVVVDKLFDLCLYSNIMAFFQTKPTLKACANWPAA